MKSVISAILIKKNETNLILYHMIDAMRKAYGEVLLVHWQLYGLFKLGGMVTIAFQWFW